jgi:hypothetical protein
MPKTDNPGDLRIASLQVGFDNVDQLIGGSAWSEVGFRFGSST